MRKHATRRLPPPAPIVSSARVPLAACPPVPLAARRAFSLAELMIALVILGLGLLFIAAALPAGLEYTKQTLDLTTGRDAVDYAYETLDMNVRVSQQLYDRSIAAAFGGPQNPVVGIRVENIFRPRLIPNTLLNPLPSPPRVPYTAVERVFGAYPVIESFADQFPNPSAVVNAVAEPFVKVRPFVMGNIPFDDDGSRQIVDDAEATIRAYVTLLGIVNGMDPSFPWTSQVDFVQGDQRGLSLADNPAVPALARVYPPPPSVKPFTVAAFYDASDATYPAYDRRRDVGGAFAWNEEYERAIDERVGWTAFYRRVGYYGDAGPDAKFGSDQSGAAYDNTRIGDTDDNVPDPLLYEIIVVVTRRTSVNHRYPRQNLSGNISDFEQPRALDPASAPGDNFLAGTDRVAPTPWLVIFDRASAGATPPAIPVVRPTDYDSIFPNPRRILDQNFVEPATLTFICKPEVGRLLPAGSVFIPATNDQGIQNGQTRQRVGFTPFTDQLPIYEVIERSDDATQITVKNNGFHPWLAAPNVIAPFAVWVIPPSFSERAGRQNQPVYDRRSPILSVSRRVVRLHEVMP